MTHKMSNTKVSLPKAVSAKVECESIEGKTTADTTSQRDLYAFALEFAPFGACFVTSDGTPLMINRQLAEWLNIPCEQLMFLPFVENINQDDQALFSRALRRVSLGGKGYRDIEIRLECPHGKQRWVAVTMTRLANAKGCDVVIYLSDISRRKQAEEEWMKLATLDHLTGLANRMVFDEEIDAVMKKCKRYHRKASVLYVDLDDFKGINDNFGHKAGDAILKETARVLKNSLRETDIVARIGGDEFAVIMDEISEREANQKAKRVTKAINNIKVEAHGNLVTVSASVGVHTFDHNHTDIDHIIESADQAMYASKAQGKKSKRLHA